MYEEGSSAQRRAKESDVITLPLPESVKAIFAVFNSPAVEPQVYVPVEILPAEVEEVTVAEEVTDIA